MRREFVVDVDHVESGSLQQLRGRHPPRDIDTHRSGERPGSWWRCHRHDHHDHQSPPGTALAGGLRDEMAQFTGGQRLQPLNRPDERVIELEFLDLFSKLALAD